MTNALHAEITGPIFDLDPEWYPAFDGGAFAGIIAAVLLFFGDCVSCSHEALGDYEAEYRGEVARFGDAWPGAADGLARMREGARQAEADYEALRFAANGPKVEVVPVSITTDDGLAF